ncbi:hypothetical protein VNI00_012990 [Paramarasmius palmivorus]|uniref:Uncharacterized protein n=1 Tax=Paramarasmius palmivorus TaxID=297713 RepID=A0AAW0BZQ6_9AGAR
MIDDSQYTLAEDYAPHTAPPPDLEGHTIPWTLRTFEEECILSALCDPAEPYPFPEPVPELVLVLVVKNPGETFAVFKARRDEANNKFDADAASYETASARRAEDLDTWKAFCVAYEQEEDLEVRQWIAQQKTDELIAKALRDEEEKAKREAEEKEKEAAEGKGKEKEAAEDEDEDMVKVEVPLAAQAQAWASTAGKRRVLVLDYVDPPALGASSSKGKGKAKATAGEESGEKNDKEKQPIKTRGEKTTLPGEKGFWALVEKGLECESCTKKGPTSPCWVQVQNTGAKRPITQCSVCRGRCGGCSFAKNKHASAETVDEETMDNVRECLAEVKMLRTDVMDKIDRKHWSTRVRMDRIEKKLDALLRHFKLTSSDEEEEEEEEEEDEKEEKRKTRLSKRRRV